RGARYPALLLPSEAHHRRFVSAVSGQNRGHAQAADLLQHAGTRRARGFDAGPRGGAGAARRDGTAAAEPSAGLPDLRQGGRMLAAELLDALRQQNFARTGAAPQAAEANRYRRADAARPGALYPLPALRALLPRGQQDLRTRHLPPGRSHGARYLRRPPPRQRLLDVHGGYL